MNCRFSSRNNKKLQGEHLRPRSQSQATLFEMCNHSNIRSFNIALPVFPEVNTIRAENLKLDYGPQVL